MLVNECVCYMYCVFNLRETSVLVETWVISSHRAQMFCGNHLQVGTHQNKHFVLRFKSPAVSSNGSSIYALNGKSEGNRMARKAKQSTTVSGGVK